MSCITFARQEINLSRFPPEMVIYEKSFLQLLATSAILCYTTAVVAPAKPNIVWFLTDDQDQVLGGSFPELNGVGPMPQTKAILSAGGSTATNFFIHTPICCPSRSELLSGRYFHNIKSTDGSGCMHVNETKVNPYTFARYLEEGGYTVGMFGKYLNTVPADVPPGFDVWMANGGGDYVSPRFATKNINFMVTSNACPCTDQSCHGIGQSCHSVDQSCHSVGQSCHCVGQSCHSTG